MYSLNPFSWINKAFQLMPTNNFTAIEEPNEMTTLDWPATEESAHILQLFTPEILIEIISRCPIREQCRIAGVSTKWHSLLSSDRNLIKNVFVKMKPYFKSDKLISSNSREYATTPSMYLFYLSKTGESLDLEVRTDQDKINDANTVNKHSLIFKLEMYVDLKNLENGELVQWSIPSDFKVFLMRKPIEMQHMKEFPHKKLVEHVQMILTARKQKLMESENLEG